MTVLIHPTVGRKVWFHPQKEDVAEGVDYRDQPLDATIVYVHSAGLVNLHVLDASGTAWKFEHVILLPGERNWDFPVRCAVWMPYQLKEARKTNPQSQNSNSLYVDSPQRGPKTTC